ncbi:MAG: hypothetical protein RIC38_12130, partial [Chromatocurvus sp.]
MKHDQPTTERRRFLTLVGGGAVMLPFAGLAACSSEEPAAPTIAASAKDTAAKRPDPAAPDESTMAKAEASAEKAASEAQQMAQSGAEGMGDSGSLPKLSEDDVQATSLGYKHIASDVDTSKQPRYK